VTSTLAPPLTLSVTVFRAHDLAPAPDPIPDTDTETVMDPAAVTVTDPDLDGDLDVVRDGVLPRSPAPLRVDTAPANPTPSFVSRFTFPVSRSGRAAGTPSPPLCYAWIVRGLAPISS